jgi:HEAT repeat protein
VSAGREQGDEATLEALASSLGGAPGPASKAALALAAYGERAIPLVLAALDDPSRRVAAAVALGRIGAASTVRQLRRLAADAEAMVRAAAAVGLYRAGDRDAGLWSAWIAREPHIAVLGFLAAIAAAVPIDAEARAALEAQAAEPSTPADVRANCVWAVAAHDPARGRALAEALDGAGRSVLAAIVARRGGPLAPDFGGGDSRADRTAETLGFS